MKTSTITTLEQQIAALGRPGLEFRTMGTVAKSLANAKAWDAANPDKAAEYHRLVAELEAETKRIEREEASRLQLERALRHMAVKLERSGIGERSLHAAQAAEDTEALGVVKRWLPDNALTWLVLCGAKGVGKSVAATWACVEVIKGGGTAAAITAPRLATLSQFEAGAEELAWLKRVDMLLVDDVGTELLTDFAKARMHELFEERHETYRRTVVTSNLTWRTTTRDGQTIPGLEQRLGERIVDRMTQAGRVVQLSAGKSMRRRGAA